VIDEFVFAGRRRGISGSVSQDGQNALLRS
jgi:hypothetical protein